MEHISMKETPDELRPYERCRQHGPEALTDAELLAVILRTGTRNKNVLMIAQELMMKSGPKKGIRGLMHHTYEEYLTISGIGKVKATQLVCLGELSKRLWQEEQSEYKGRCTNPELTASYYMQEIKHLEREELRLVFLDTRRKIIRDKIISSGTVSSSIASVREILIETLKYQAVYLIMIHNHPSGEVSPSDDDIRVTEKIKQGCKSIGIQLDDHIIIGDNNYYSFKERGLL